MYLSKDTRLRPTVMNVYAFGISERSTFQMLWTQQHEKLDEQMTFPVVFPFVSGTDPRVSFSCSLCRRESSP